MIGYQKVSDEDGSSFSFVPDEHQEDNVVHDGHLEGQVYAS